MELTRGAIFVLRSDLQVGEVMEMAPPLPRTGGTDTCSCEVARRCDDVAGGLLL